jgi:hypothetical protein
MNTQILKADVIRGQQFMLRREQLARDFKKVVEETRTRLLESLEMIQNNSLHITLPDSYKETPDLAKELSAKLVIYFKEKGFEIIGLQSDHMGFSFQWRNDKIDNLFESLFAECKTPKEKIALTEGMELDAATVRAQQIALHQQPIQEELQKLKEQCVSKIASRVTDTQLPFQEDILLTFDDCAAEYTPLLFHYMTKELRKEQYHVSVLIDNQQLRVSWSEITDPSNGIDPPKPGEALPSLVPPISSFPDNKSKVPVVTEELQHLSDQALVTRLVSTSRSYALATMLQQDEYAAQIDTHRSELAKVMSVILGRMKS